MKLVRLSFIALLLLAAGPALADDFATVSWIQTPDPNGKWSKVDKTNEAVVVTDAGEVPVERGMPLAKDSLIRTAMVRVGVEVDKNSIEIHEGSEARIQEQGVLQMLGNLYYKVKGNFTVSYGAVEASVEGTEFEVHGPEPQWVGVTKGKVRVKTASGEVRLKKNQRVDVDADGALGEVKGWAHCRECGKRHEKY